MRFHGTVGFSSNYSYLFTRMIDLSVDFCFSMQLFLSFLFTCWSVDLFKDMYGRMHLALHGNYSASFMSVFIYIYEIYIYIYINIPLSLSLSLVLSLSIYIYIYIYTYTYIYIYIYLSIYLQNIHSFIHSFMN